MLLVNSEPNQKKCYIQQTTEHSDTSKAGNLLTYLTTILVTENLRPGIGLANAYI